MARPASSSPRSSALADAVIVAVSPSSPAGRVLQRQPLSLAPPELARADLAPQLLACPTCGGSGMLRTNVQSHRTCMDCLGGGQRLLTSADLLRQAGLTAVASFSGAG